MQNIQYNAIRTGVFATYIEEMWVRQSSAPPLNDHALTVFTATHVELLRHRPTGKMALKGNADDISLLAARLGDIIPGITQYHSEDRAIFGRWTRKWHSNGEAIDLLGYVLFPPIDEVNKPQKPATNTSCPIITPESRMANYVRSWEMGDLDIFAIGDVDIHSANRRNIRAEIFPI